MFYMKGEDDDPDTAMLPGDDVTPVNVDEEDEADKTEVQSKTKLKIGH